MEIHSKMMHLSDKADEFYRKEYSDFEQYLIKKHIEEKGVTVIKSESNFTPFWERSNYKQK